MPGFMPGIHVFHSQAKKGVDGRDKPGHDGELCTAVDEPALALT
jgi:hypothetical protein